MFILKYMNENKHNANNVTLKEVIEVIDEIYPRQLAEKWDSVGLISGDLNQKINKIFIAIDPVEETVNEAINKNADLLFTHHPLFLSGTKTVATTDPKGKLIYSLIKNDCALFNAHTNADRAKYGVSQALGDLVPMKNKEILEDAELECGLGVIGEIEPMTLKEFAQILAKQLPETAPGLQIGGDLNKIVQKVAFSPGSGQSMLNIVLEKKADVFVCADLKHHVASEFLMHNSTSLIMPTHWASEWPWVKQCKTILEKKFKEKNMQISVEYSTIVTDPWTANSNTLEEK